MTLRLSARCSLGFRGSWALSAVSNASRPCVEGRQPGTGNGGTSLDVRWMSYSTSACVGFAGFNSRRSSRKSISPNLLGGTAVACLSFDASDITAALARCAMSRTTAPGDIADRASAGYAGAAGSAATCTGAGAGSLVFTDAASLGASLRDFGACAILGGSGCGFDATL